MKKIKQFWNWYNGIKEPWRMLFALSILCSPMHIGNLTGNFLVGAAIMISILLSKIISEWK